MEYKSLPLNNESKGGEGREEKVKLKEGASNEQRKNRVFDKTVVGGERETSDSPLSHRSVRGNQRHLRPFFGRMRGGKDSPDSAEELPAKGGDQPSEKKGEIGERERVSGHSRGMRKTSIETKTEPAASLRGKCSRLHEKGAGGHLVGGGVGKGEGRSKFL